MPELELGPLLYLGSCTQDRWEFRINVLIRGAGVEACSVAVAAGTSNVEVAGAPVIAADFTEACGVDLVLWQFTVRADRASAPTTAAYRLVSTGADVRRCPDAVFQVAIPSRDRVPGLAFFSCNGIDDPKRLNRVDRIHGLWEKLLDRHKERPYHVLLGGGDQIYADCLWDQDHGSSALRRFESPLSVRKKHSLSVAQQRRLLRDYVELYCKRWSKPVPAAAHASIPGAFTWDDHDIFDGWGSYHDDRQSFDVFQSVFEAASRAFEAFQLGSCSRLGGPSPAGLVGDGSHALQAFELEGGDSRIDVLLLDGRTARRKNQVLGSSQWTALKAWLEQDRLGASRHLLVVSSMPLVYMDFSAALRVFELTPGHQDLEDDMRDHWTSRRHRGERSKLVMNLLAHGQANRTRVTLLSGDVHVGARGRIESDHPKHRIDGNEVGIEQLVSSGIVYPPPTPAEFWAVRKTGTEFRSRLGDHVYADVVPLSGEHYYLRDRNYLAIHPEHEGGDCRLWFEYVAETVELPECVVVDSFPVAP